MYRFKTKEELNSISKLNGEEALKQDLEIGSTLGFDYYFKKIELPVVELKIDYTHQYQN